MKKWKFILLLCSLLMGGYTTQLHAQRGTAAAGGDHNNTVGSLSFTIGLVDYDYLLAPNCEMTLGHQQPHEFWVVTEVESSQIPVEVTVYPNPASDHIVVQVSHYENEVVDLTLIDQNGRPVKSAQFSGGKVVLGLDDLSLGIYFVKVSHEGESLKVYKILKAN